MPILKMTKYEPHELSQAVSQPITGTTMKKKFSRQYRSTSIWTVLCVASAFMMLALPAAATNGVGLSNQMIGHTVHNHEKDIHYNYDYNVSAMQVGDEIKLWWCGGGVYPNSGLDAPADTIYYASYDASTFVEKEAPRAVFAEGPVGTWDSGLTCNPSVITGTFHPSPLAGTFNYAMYYVAVAPSGNSYTRNKIGVAFSTDGKIWTRYPHPLDLRPGPACSDGYQSPSAIGIDGHKIRLSYIDWCGAVVVNGHAQKPVYIAVSPDGVNFATPELMPLDGLFPQVSLGEWGPTYLSLSFDTGRHQWVADVNFGRSRSDAAGKHESMDLGYGVFVMDGVSAESAPAGKWTAIHQIDTNTTGYEVNAYPSTLHDPNGWVHDGVSGYPNYLTYFTLSNPRLPFGVSSSAAVDATTIGVWDISFVSLTNDTSLTTPLVQYLKSNTLLATTGYKPPDFSANTAVGKGTLYESPKPGSVPLYSCQAGSSQYYYTTRNTLCDSSDDRFIGLQGYALLNSGAGTIPLYDCRVRPLAYFFVSSHADCEGQSVVSFLGYILPN